MIITMFGSPYNTLYLSGVKLYLQLGCVDMPMSAEQVKKTEIECIALL